MKETKVFFSKNEGLDDYLKAWKDGTFPMGLSTGISLLDEHFRFKEGHFNIFGGLDNVGKSTVIWYLMVLSAMFHEWKWGVYCAENGSDEITKKMIEFYWGKSIRNLTEKQIKVGKEWVLSHFKFIETEGLPTYKDIIAFIEQFSEFSGILIDPWNALIESGNGNKHDDDYAAIKHLKQYTKEQGKCVYINAHVVTSAARVDKESLQIPAPKKADIEGGNKFANKADDVVMIHRHIYDPQSKFDTELHVAKVKRTETGGGVTQFSKPVILTSLPGLVGFKCNGVDPVYNYHASRSMNQQAFFTKVQEEEEPF